MKRDMKKRFVTGLAAFAMLLSQLAMPAQAAYATQGEPHRPNPGTIKVRDIADEDDLPENNPMLTTCSVVVEFYDFDNTTDENASVVFTEQAPTDDVDIAVSGDTLTPIISADGGEENGVADEDGEYTYTLAFTGTPKETGNTTGYHVSLDVKVDGTRGGTKSKTFWMPASCQATVVKSVTPSATVIDTCETANDSVTAVAVEGITYSDVIKTGLTYTLTASPASAEYKLVLVDDSGFELNEDGTATFSKTLTDIDCGANLKETPLPMGVADICGTGNDSVPMPGESDNYTIKYDSGWKQDGQDAVKTVRTITYETLPGYVFTGSEGWVLSEDKTQATYIFTDWGTKCPSENVCTVSNNLFDSEWKFDSVTYPEAGAYGGVTPGTYNFEPTGLYINTPATESYVDGLMDAGMTPLADVDAMSYQVKRLAKSAGYDATLPAYILLVDTVGKGNSDDMKYFFYEPYNNDNSRATIEDEFQLWDAKDGGNAKWWMSGTGQTLRTWSYFVSQFPEAVVVAYGFNQGTYNADTYSAVQDIEFDCATTSFTNNNEGGNGGTGETPVTPSTPVVPTLPVGGQGSVLPAELPMTGANGSVLSTWVALLAAVLTYGAVYFLQPKRRAED